MMYKS